MRYQVQDLIKHCASCAPALLGDLLSAGRMAGDGSMEIEEAAFARFTAKCSTLKACPGKASGLGDVLHAVLKPIAAASDALLGTDLVNCPNCSARQEGLNKLLPL